jgi:hypothetical protein
MAIAREAADARAIPAHHQAAAVVFDLVDPERAGRWPLHLRRQARFDEAGGTAHDHALSSPLARPPCRWRIARRDFGRAQRHQMAALVRIAANFQAVLAPHVAFQLMDRRRLRSPHDVERNGLIGVATEATNFEIAVSGIERVAERGRLAAPDPESRACACSTPRTQANRLACGLRSPALPPPGSSCRRSSRAIWCPWRQDRPATMGRQAATDCGGWRAGHNGDRIA